MSTQLVNPDHVEAEVNYLRYTGQRPANYAYQAPQGVPQRTGIPDLQRVQIANARQLAEPPTLDRNGFQLLAHRTAVTDFSNGDLIRAVYYREAEDILRQVTGAEKVVIFDHTLRSAAERLGRRFAIINLWRPIGSTIESWPLAMLDGRTLDTEDLVASDLIYPDKVGETYAVIHRARHRWFYFPRLQPDEVVLLKIYDSQTDGPVRLSAHTAFEDPTSRPDAPARRSIELRALVFYPS
jgi:hypothetical protein